MLPQEKSYKYILILLLAPRLVGSGSEPKGLRFLGNWAKWLWAKLSQVSAYKKLPAHCDGNLVLLLRNESSTDQKDDFHFNISLV